MSFTLREATITDVPALAALHVETFNETYGSNPNGPKYALREYQWQRAFLEKNTSWFCYVIEDGEGKLVGFAKGQTYQHPYHVQFAGELNKLYLLRSHHKMGLGKKLLCTVARAFINRGIVSMLLFGHANNPSNGFYERMGGDKLYAKDGEFHGGYGWKDLQKLVIHCKAV